MIIVVTEQLVCTHQVDVFLSPPEMFFNALNLFVDEYRIEFIVIASDRRTRSSSEPCSFGPDSIFLFRSQTSFASADVFSDEYHIEHSLVSCLGASS
jgi:hypothetical protein